jgi:hypothetical protein
MTDRDASALDDVQPIDLDLKPIPARAQRGGLDR